MGEFYSIVEIKGKPRLIWHTNMLPPEPWNHVNSRVYIYQGNIYAAVIVFKAENSLEWIGYRMKRYTENGDYSQGFNGLWWKVPQRTNAMRQRYPAHLIAMGEKLLKESM